VKAQWLKLAARIDRATLRQRIGVFAACATVVLYLLFMLALDPLLREQARLRGQIAQQRAAIAGVDTTITSLLDAFARDPDAASRQRLAAARSETRTLSDSLAAMQKGLVTPQQMAPLLQTILRANGRLQLVALTTLPVTVVGGTPPASAASPTATAAPAVPAAPAVALPAAGLLYRHGVQVTVQGTYMDMLDYMATLERLPTQLFWGEARLDVDAYPRAHVTLTLYTLSLDSKWLKL
jgi:MSHA biogenesis protein MshJ